MTQKPKKLLDQVHDTLRRKQYAYRTEDTYVNWIKGYIHFHDIKHPKDMGEQQPAGEPPSGARSAAANGWADSYVN